MRCLLCAEMLVDACRLDQRVVFVLNDMSRFVGASRSTTLYMLLDLLHTHTGVAVVGISTVDEVLDLMEKRAQSRFDLQNVFVVPSLSTTMGDEVCSPPVVCNSSANRLAHAELQHTPCQDLQLSDS